MSAELSKTNGSGEKERKTRYDLLNTRSEVNATKVSSTRDMLDASNNEAVTPNELTASYSSGCSAKIKV